MKSEKKLLMKKIEELDSSLVTIIVSIISGIAAGVIIIYKLIKLFLKDNEKE